MSKGAHGERPPDGEIRQAQLITTFGPGAMMDLPKHAVLVGGLAFWSQGAIINEPRLSARLAVLLGLSSIELHAPPAAEGEDKAWFGVRVFQFPEWFLAAAPEQGELEDRQGVRARALVHRKALTGGAYVDRDRRRRPVVPVRFVRACPRGHIGDIDWYAFAHRGASDCKKQGQELFLDERGTGGDLGDLAVRCACGSQRPLIEARELKTWPLGRCGGERPWLGASSREDCELPSRLLTRAASNAYFPQAMSVISLPDRRQAVRAAVDAAWGFLENANSLEKVGEMFQWRAVKPLVSGITDEEVWAELEQRRGGLSEETPVKQAELEVLAAAQEELGEDRPDGVFYARALAGDQWRRAWTAAVERVVLAHRLREVVALAGFTRFEPPALDDQGELDLGVRRAALALETKWLPAYENHGEGIFLQFRSDAVREWASRSAVQRRYAALREGFMAWRAEHQESKAELPDPAYWMLHSFAHLLLTAITLGCGYPASSLRERVYAVSGSGYGILIYTGAPDAEGTLGGLVEAGRRIGEFGEAALRLGALCSNDPVCAQHSPAVGHERRFLQGAACHGCLLIAETSCERHNQFLDRALVVPTLELPGSEFFPSAAAAGA